MTSTPIRDPARRSRSPNCPQRLLSACSTTVRPSRVKGAGCVIAILSPDAKDSEWVNEELGYAKIRKLRIFTVLARGDESNALPLGLTGV